MIKPNADILFEIAWEVCNKVGGIYTVVSSKADIAKKHYKEYYLIGPYVKNQADTCFKEISTPKKFEEVFKQLKEKGIKCYFGEWQIKGEPNVILIDFTELIKQKNKIKEDLWNDYQIDSLNSNWDFDEALVWATSVGMLLEEFVKYTENKQIVAHFHEWLAGLAILHLKKYKINIGTVFTTHATMLGRTIAGNGQDLYSLLPTLNPIEKAYELGVADKYLTEKACAHNTDVFTTVSEITAIEAEKILERKADVLVLNGLDIEKFPTVEECSVNHIICRDRIREFLSFHFFPYYLFDINHTLIIFILGRYEFKNKGIDIFIKSLGILNERLKKEGSKRTVAAFFWIPQETYGTKREVLENKNNYRHIKSLIEFNSKKILSNIVYDLISNKDISQNNIFTHDFLMSIKNSILHLKKEGNPSIVTHHINNENNDPITKGLIENGLLNRKEDNVKAILYPVYLDGNDGLIDLSIYDAIAGCHLGVFPSYYEPWGYTPLEAGALGIPSITSDLSGFGRFVNNKIKMDDHSGVFVLKRHNQDNKEVVKDFSEFLHKFSKSNKHSRIKNKLNAKEISALADWKILIENYIKAHNLALERIRPN